MKCINIFVLAILLSTAYYANAKPFVGIDTSGISLGIPPIPQIPDIPSIPQVPGIPQGRRDFESANTEAPKEEVENMDKSESVAFGYYPYYYGWPYYYPYRYPYAYIGK